MNPAQDSKEEGIQVIHHSSFFDSPGCKTKVFTPFNLKKTPNPFTNDNPIYSKGFLFKKNSAGNQPLKKRFFFMAEDGIYYSKEANAGVKKYMSFENTRVLYETHPESGEKKKSCKDWQFVIKLYRNFNIAEVATDDSEVFNTWRRILAYKCIQHTFHEEFEVKKMIGKGSFAKVFYLVLPPSPIFFRLFFECTIFPILGIFYFSIFQFLVFLSLH